MLRELIRILHSTLHLQNHTIPGKIHNQIDFPHRHRLLGCHRHFRLLVVVSTDSDSVVGFQHHRTLQLCRQIQHRSSQPPIMEHFRHSRAALARRPGCTVLR